jgi:hypothetical protein
MSDSHVEWRQDARGLWGRRNPLSFAKPANKGRLRSPDTRRPVADLVFLDVPGRRLSECAIDGRLREGIGEYLY